MMRARLKYVGVYLAAGSSSRMGERKLALELTPGRPLGAFALREALASALSAVVVVVRDESMCYLLTQELLSDRIFPIICAESHEGMSRSLQCGVKAADQLGAEAAVVLLADQPFVRAADIDALLQAREADATLDYAALAEQGHPKPPILLARSMFSSVARLEGDVGARALLRDACFRGKLLPPGDESCFLDADTPEDWAAIVTHLRIKSV